MAKERLSYKSPDNEILLEISLQESYSLLRWLEGEKDLSGDDSRTPQQLDVKEVARRLRWKLFGKGRR